MVRSTRTPIASSDTVGPCDAAASGVVLSSDAPTLAKPAFFKKSLRLLFTMLTCSQVVLLPGVFASSASTGSFFHTL